MSVHEEAFASSKKTLLSWNRSKIYLLSQNITPKEQHFCYFLFFNECNSNNAATMRSYSNKGLAKKITKLKTNNMKSNDFEIKIPKWT